MIKSLIFLALTTVFVTVLQVNSQIFISSLRITFKLSGKADFKLDFFQESVAKEWNKKQIFKQKVKDGWPTIPKKKPQDDSFKTTKQRKEEKLKASMLLKEESMEVWSINFLVFMK